MNLKPLIVTLENTVNQTLRDYVSIWINLWFDFYFFIFIIIFQRELVVWFDFKRKSKKRLQLKHVDGIDQIK